MKYLRTASRLAGLGRRCLPLLGLSLLCLPLNNAEAYETDPGMEPTDLAIQLVLNTAPIHNEFTRHLTFTNRAGNTKSVSVAFFKTSDLHYEGTATPDGIATLESLADENNRSYWDAMKFENKGGTTPLDISQIFVDVEYANTCCNRSPVAQIGYMVNQYLAAGNASFALPGIGGSGRINYARDYLGITYDELMSYPDALKYFIYDIGKSGSSDSTDSASSSNPKYGLTGSALCSETISWYYHTYGVRFTGQVYPFPEYDLRDISSHAVMRDQFMAGGRLYCYHSGRQAWVMKSLSDQWMFGSTYVPQPGDYLDRRDSDGDLSNGDDGHAMMIAKWDAATGIATTLDGPWNINFRPVPVAQDEDAGLRDYCVGRLPENE